MRQINAIVYTSNTGFTARYASLLSKETGIPCCPLSESGSLAPGAQIFYMGWLMAGQIKGVKKAAARFSLAGACGVGMGKPEDNPPDELRKTNQLGDLPLFSLRGGYAPNKIKGVYKLMMGFATKAMAGKSEQSGKGLEMPSIVRDGADFVSADQLHGILSWIHEG